MLDYEITLNRLELYLLDLPQKSVFKSGIGIRKSKETLIIKWIDQDGFVGYGECSCRPDPYYSAEFLEASVIMIQRFVAPQLKKKQTYKEVLQVLHKIRGWNFTKSAIESAMFQIIKSKYSYDLSKDLASEATANIPVGISLGIFDDPKQMQDVVSEAIDDGYKRVKFKISPTVNIKNFDYINPLLFDQKVHVSFDANGSYQSSDLAKLEYFVKTYDTHIEQPTPPNRFDTLLQARQLFPTLKVCFDEGVKNIGDVVKLKELGVLDELNLKIGRVGGIHHSIQILNYCYENSIPCWIGGMFETGIGRMQNLALAAFLPHAIAHDLSPSSRYFKEDIISPEIEMKDGYIHLESALLGLVIPEKLEKYSTEKIVVIQY